MYRAYLNRISQALEGVCATQGEALERAARRVGHTLHKDGLIYLFGCGHSHMLAEEGFYRAGGLGAVCPILPAELMLHEGAVKSSDLERRAELAPEVLARYPLTPADTLVVFSTSGINGMPVEIARLGRETGASVIGVSSGAYEGDPSRHPQGLRLSQACDIHIDNHAPHGDAAYDLQGMQGKMGPLSTISGAYILNCLLARGAELAALAGAEPAVYHSGNVPGGRERNQAVIRRYRQRIRAL